MAGRYNDNVEPILPGSYFQFIADTIELPPASVGQTLMLPVVHDWGPIDTAVLVRNYQEWLLIFGDSDTPGRRAVFGAFTGEGYAGKGGAGNVIVYRMAGTSVAASEVTLLNTNADDAATFTALYQGERGNRYRWTVRPAATAGRKEVVILDGARELEVYEIAQADIADLVDQVNAHSGLYSGVVVDGSTALADVTAAAPTGGDDGATLTSGDWTSMANNVEFEPFSVFCPFDLTDAPTQAALKAWVLDVNSRSKGITALFGGVIDETFSAHQTRAQGYNSEDIIAFGTGRIAESIYSADGTEVEISTSQAAPRLAGSVCRRGERADVVMARFRGWRIVSGPTLAQAELAAQSGMAVLTRDGHRVAPVKVALAPTSYQGGEDGKPLRIYGNVKFMRTIHGLERDIAEDQESGDLIGEVGVTDRTRDLVLGRAVKILSDRIRDEIITSDSTVKFDPDVTTSDTDDFVALVYEVGLVPGLRKIKNKIRVTG